MKILIAGYGYVGKAVGKLFPKALIYDKKYYEGIPPDTLPEKVKGHYDFCMVCVPTPQKEDGTCDISAVEDVIDKIDADVFVIRSTVSPGTTEDLAIRKNPFKPNCVMQPEYIASSSPYPAPMSDIRKHPFIILGGDEESVKKTRRLYESVYPPTTEIFECSGIEAELIKLFENTYIANKVAICNEFFNIVCSYGVDYDRIREGVFRLDPRMTEWWTLIYADKRGFANSHCLGKDLSNLIKSCEARGYDPKFLKAIKERENG